MRFCQIANLFGQVSRPIYFKMVNDIGVFLIPPGILMGILGVVVAKIFTFKNERQMIKSKPV